MLLYLCWYISMTTEVIVWEGCGCHCVLESIYSCRFNCQYLYFCFPSDHISNLNCRVTHLHRSGSRWYLGRWHTDCWSSRPPSAQTPERRNQTPHRQSTGTPASPRPGSACSAAWYQPRTPACFTPLLQVANRFKSRLRVSPRRKLLSSLLFSVFCSSNSSSSSFKQ